MKNVSRETLMNGVSVLLHIVESVIVSRETILEM